MTLRVTAGLPGRTDRTAWSATACRIGLPVPHLRTDTLPANAAQVTEAGPALHRSGTSTRDFCGWGVIDGSGRLRRLTGGAIGATRAFGMGAQAALPD